MTAQRIVAALYATALLAEAVIALAVVGLWLRPAPAAPRPRPIIVAGDRYPDRRDRALAAENAKIDRELRAIRESLDHVTVRVHLQPCCGGER